MKNALANMIKLLLGLALSAAFLYWAFADVDLDDVLQQIRQLDAQVLTAFVFVQAIILLVRILRWGILVAPLAPISNRAMFASGAIGFPATFFLPFRLGEFVRPAIVQRAGTPFTGAMAAVVVERIVDGVLNVLFFFALPFLIDLELPAELRTIALLALAGFGGGLVFLVLLVVMEDTALRWTGRILSRFSEALADKVEGLLVQFVQGVRVLKAPRSALLFLLTTSLYWGLNGVTVGWLAQALAPGTHLLSGFFAMAVVVFAIMIPAAPGFVGTMEAGFRLGFAPFGVTVQTAAVLAVVFHVTAAVLLTILGGIGVASAPKAQVASN